MNDVFVSCFVANKHSTSRDISLLYLLLSNSIKQPYNMKRIILLIIAAQQYCNVVDGALSTVVESGEEECFVVRAKSNSLIR